MKFLKMQQKRKLQKFLAADNWKIKDDKKHRNYENPLETGGFSCYNLVVVTIKHACQFPAGALDAG